MTIAEMRLSPHAQHAAELVQAAHPWIVFTSGRRDPHGQALAMAVNVKADRHWIFKTYKPGPHTEQFEYWLQNHPDAKSVDEIAHGLYSVMMGMDPLHLRNVSRHFTGDAWDAQYPPEDKVEALLDTIYNLPVELGLEKVLTKEGALKIIHAQFAPSAEV